MLKVIVIIMEATKAFQASCSVTSVAMEGVRSTVSYIICRGYISSDVVKYNELCALLTHHLNIM